MQQFDAFCYHDTQLLQDLFPIGFNGNIGANIITPTVIFTGSSKILKRDHLCVKKLIYRKGEKRTDSSDYVNVQNFGYILKRDLEPLDPFPESFPELSNKK